MTRTRLPIDTDAGLVTAIVSAIYAAAVAGVRGIVPDRLSGTGWMLSVLVIAALGFVVGGAIAGRPDFGRTRRAALVRGFVAAIPIYAAGGMLLLPPERWFPLLFVFAVVPAALVGPPIGIFMYRLYRRPRASGDTPGIFDRSTQADVHDHHAPDDPSVDLAWQKGELLGSWTPLLISIALFASFGLGSLAIEMADLELRGLTTRQDPPRPVADRIADLRDSVVADSANTRLRLDLGRALASLGQFEEAVEHLTVAAGLDSADAALWVMLGRAAFFSQRYAKAFEAYWNAQRLDSLAVRPSGLDRAIWRALLAQRTTVPISD